MSAAALSPARVASARVAPPRPAAPRGPAAGARTTEPRTTDARTTSGRVGASGGPAGVRVDDVSGVEGLSSGGLGGGGLGGGCAGAGPALEAELAAARQEIAGLRVALTSRATIDQARGILIARYRISADGAFELLVRWSQDRNIKLRVIAETLVAMAQHGVEAPHACPSLARWLDQQLMEPSAGP
ncbi:MAG TPA: ANTAR domain-containing protein [Mycobacteriales bacterium]|nr:ANTAR domain-containing protein [Mycobacteriales bacterium]